MTFKQKTKSPRSLRDWSRLRRCFGDYTTSGPGMALKTEAMGLAVAVEIPLVVCDIQRGVLRRAPDQNRAGRLLQALFGRNSEAPIPIVAAATPSDCFWAALEASRIAVKYMVPVILLSDVTLPMARNRGAFPMPRTFRRSGEIATEQILQADTCRTSAIRKRWLDPGGSRNSGSRTRIGGLEKQDVSGNINYER